MFSIVVRVTNFRLGKKVWYGIKDGTFRQVRCDQGSELAKRSQFRQVIQQEGYSIEPTGSNNSSQNGVAERPNRT